MEGWSVNITEDLNSFGAATTITYATIGNATSGNCIPGFVPPGNQVQTTQSIQGTFPMTTEVYTQASGVLLNPQKNLNLLNTDPIIFISIPKGRVAAWNSFTANGTIKFPNIKEKYGDNYGVGLSAWTAIDVFNALSGIKSLNNANGSKLTIANNCALNNVFNYHISYFRVEPYANLKQIVQTLFPEPTPLLWSVDSNGDYTVDLINNSVSGSTVANNTVSLSYKYVPQRPKMMMMLGGFGDPASMYTNSFTNKGTPFTNSCESGSGAGVKTGASGNASVMAVSPTNFGVAQKLPIQWARTVPGMLSGSISMKSGDPISYSQLLTGKLDVAKAKMDTNSINQMNIGIVPTLNPLGMPLFTLTSISTNTKEADQILNSTLSSTSQSKTTVVTANTGILLGFGEGSTDYSPPIITQTVTTTFIDANFMDSSGTYCSSNPNGTPAFVPSSVNITFSAYEDMNSSARDELNLATNTFTGTGRKRLEEKYTYQLFTQDSAEFSSGIYYGAIPVNSNPIDVNMDLKDNGVYLYLTKVERVEYIPVGLSGFSKSMFTISYDPVSGSSSSEASGSDEGGGYISQLNFGIGAVKLRVNVGSGEPQQVHLPFCGSYTELQNYGNALLAYTGSYTEVTETTKDGMCDIAKLIALGKQLNNKYKAGAPNSTAPGKQGTYGTILSVSTVVSAQQSTITTTYRTR